MPSKPDEQLVELDPERLAFWESTLAYAHTTGPMPYPPDAGYNPNQSEHYDPIEVYRLVQDYCERRDIDPRDYSAQRDAAIIRYRDDYILRDAAGGLIPGHVTYTTGMAHHWQLTGDPLNVKAIDQVRPLDNGFVPASSYLSYYMDRFSTPYLHRETGYRVKSYLDRRRVGLPKHEYQNVDLDIVLDHYRHVALPKSRRYGAYCSPFIYGMTIRAVIDYWNFFHMEAEPDAEEQARLDIIPGEVRKILDWLWDYGWFPPGFPAPDEGGNPWDRGALKYSTPPGNGTDMLLLSGFTVLEVTGDHTFKASGPLSDVDDYYKYLCPGKTDSPTHPERYVGRYTALTREFKIDGQAFYPVPGEAFTLDLESHDGRDHASPALNLLLAHAYAWMFWYLKVVGGNERDGRIYRSRHDQMFNGAATAWAMPWLHKEYHQSALCTPLGLYYRDCGDAGIDYRTLPESPVCCPCGGPADA